MIIKIVDDSAPREVGGQVKLPNVIQNTFVKEADSYTIKRFHYGTDEAKERILREETGQEFTIPFNIDVPLRSSDLRQLMVLQVWKPEAETIVAINCHVFVTNNDGRTVDKFTVA